MKKKLNHWKMLPLSLALSTLVSCSSVSDMVENLVPEDVLGEVLDVLGKTPPVVDIPSTFRIGSVEVPTNPDTYEAIVEMIEIMVEQDILAIEVPYRGDFMSAELYPSYEYAYGQAYIQVNTTHIEYTCNTSTYVIGYRTKESGEQFIILERSDKDFTQEEILYQSQYFQDTVAQMIADLKDAGRLWTGQDPMDQLEVIYRYVTEYLNYSYEYTPFSYTGYGAVVERRAVCQGYVALFNALVKQLGFEAEGVSGVVGVGEFAMDEGHIWSRVMVGDDWVYFDPTFADRSSFSTDTGDIEYNMTYFDMSVEDMYSDRSTNFYGVNNDSLQPTPVTPS